MIDIKLKDIVNSTDTLKQLADMKLPGKVAWQVGKLLQRLEIELNLFSATREKFIRQFVDKDENGEMIVNEKTHEYVFTPENKQQFINELNEVLEENIHIDMDKISIDALADLDFTPAQMLVLEPFIE